MYICKSYCAVATVLFIGMVVCMTKAVRDPKFDEFEATLSKNLKKNIKELSKKGVKYIIKVCLFLYCLLHLLLK